MPTGMDVYKYGSLTIVDIKTWPAEARKSWEILTLLRW